jgi:hypothetical protein
METYGEWRYSSTIFWPVYYMEVSGQFHVPAASPPRKEPPVPIGQEAGWTPEPVWTTWRRENSCPHRDSNSDRSVVQPVASRYTDWAIPTPIVTYHAKHKYCLYEEGRIL